MKYIVDIPKKLTTKILEKYPTVEKYIEAMLITPLLKEYQAEKVKERSQVIEDDVKNELQLVSEKVSINITGAKPEQNSNFPDGYKPPQDASNDVIINLQTFNLCQQSYKPCAGEREPNTLKK